MGINITSVLPQVRQLYREPLYRNSIALMLNSGFNAIIGLLFWMVATRTMPSDQIGMATAAISIATLIIMASRLGMDYGFVRHLPESENKSGLYYTIIIISLVLSIALSIVFLALINFISPSMAYLQEGWFPLAFLGYIVVNSICTFQGMVFVALRRADTTLVQNLISGVRVPVLLFIGALGTIGILYALNIAFIFSLVFGTYYLINYGFSLKPTFDIVSLKKIFSYSIGNFVSIIISILPNSILPILIINLLGAEETAYYFVAYSFYSLVYMIPFGVSTSLFVEGSNRLPLKENIKKSMKFIMVLLLPVILFVVLFGDKLLLIFSEEYSIQSFDLLRLLAISTFFYSFVMIFASMMMVQKKLKIMNVFTCTNAFLIIVLGYVFLQQFGLIGLGYAWLAANVITGTLACYLIIKEKDKDV